MSSWLGSGSDDSVFMGYIFDVVLYMCVVAFGVQVNVIMHCFIHVDRQVACVVSLVDFVAPRNSVVVVDVVNELLFIQQGSPANRHLKDVCVRVYP